MTTEDLGWTAGILDGEGYLAVTAPPIYGVKVAVGNTDLRMLLALRDLWGGKIYPNRHAYPNSKPFYSWQLHGKLAFALLELVAPLLRCKREQAELLLEMRQWHGKKTSYDPLLRDYWRERRGEVYTRLRVLTRRGAA